MELFIRGSYSLEGVIDRSSFHRVDVDFSDNVSVNDYDSGNAFFVFRYSQVKQVLPAVLQTLSLCFLFSSI